MAYEVDKAIPDDRSEVPALKRDHVFIAEGKPADATGAARGIYILAHGESDPTTPRIK
jgi:hypothetical protein